MKKTTMVLNTLLVSATLIGGTTTAFAAEYDDATNAKTNANITFTADTDPTNPVDPEDPTNPVDPVEPINPNGAELMITYASDLNFGEQAKNGKSWNALADKDKDGKEYTPFVSIKDSRGTERKSWSLTVKQDDNFTTGSGADTHILKGAELTYSDLYFAEFAGKPTATPGSIVLSKDAQEIATADADTGTSKWSLGLGKLQEGAEKKTKGVTLSVPERSVKNNATYTTTLTYELTADATK